MIREIHLVFILLTASYVFSEDHKYCNVESCPNRTHTLCKYPLQEPAARCGKPIRYGLRGGEIQSLLYLYNSDIPLVTLYEVPENSELQPNNSLSLNMSMQWDNELADIAQRWANQCVNETDECRNVDNFHVRQKVGAISKLKDEARPTIHMLISKWSFDDKLTSLNDLDFGGLSFGRLANFTTDHYNRWMRRNSNRMGCGAMRSKDTLYQHLYVVCNFGPA